MSDLTNRQKHAYRLLLGNATNSVDRWSGMLKEYELDARRVEFLRAVIAHCEKRIEKDATIIKPTRHGAGRKE